jgi:hypothetical protein
LWPSLQPFQLIDVGCVAGSVVVFFSYSLKPFYSCAWPVFP